MFRKIARDILIVAGIMALWASTSRSAMKYISDGRNVDAWWGIYPRSHGDLVSRSYLDFIKKIYPGPDHCVIKNAGYTGPRNTVLYLFGDSYSAHLEDTAFAALCGLHYIDRYDGGFFKLDTTKKNILIIEYAERSVRDCFNDLRIFGLLQDSSLMKENSTASYQPVKADGSKADFGFSPGDIFNKHINQNLQFNLFNYQFIVPVFEYKAALNYYAFKRASGDVVISADGAYLFLKETTDGDNICSSYAHLQASEISNLVQNFNTIYSHYKASGFTEVYLSIIPNPSSVVQPAGYNKLIPIIQNAPALNMKVIDAYSFLTRQPQEYFYHGDTHWNIKGKQKWVDMVNELLIKMNNT